MKINSTNTQQAFPVANAANDEELALIKQKISSGDLSANAPCEGMYKEWSAEERADLKKTLGEVFGWKG